MIINTGQLSKTIIGFWLRIASDKVWCSLDNPKVHILELMLQQTESIKTLQSEEDFNIEFNILENANASIYPR
jgi:hypothetical protein